MEFDNLAHVVVKPIPFSFLCMLMKYTPYVYTEKHILVIRVMLSVSVDKIDCFIDQRGLFLLYYNCIPPTETESLPYIFTASKEGGNIEDRMGN